MKKKKTDSKLIYARTGFLLSLFGVILFGFFFVLYNVQYVHGQDYLDHAFYSVPQTETVRAARGEILDTYGRLLVSNETAYQITLNTSLMGNTQERSATIAALLELCREQNVEWTQSTLPLRLDGGRYSYDLEHASSTVQTQLRELTTARGWDNWKSHTEPGGTDPETGEALEDAEVWEPTLTPSSLMIKFRGNGGYHLSELELTPEEELELVGVLYELDLRLRDITYSEYVFASNVDITFITLVKEAQLVGVTIDTVSTRQYHTSCAPHILGRIANIDADEWRGTDTTPGYRDKEGYSFNDKIGKSGVELAFESYLHGVSGTRAIETDANGKLTSEEWLTEPQPGGNVTLTLDIQLQAAVEQALARHIEGLKESSGGAAVMVDMTGGVQAMASYPSFDLANYTKIFNDLRDDPLHPLYNRATQGTYMPGSIFKMCTAVAGLQEGVIDTSTKIRDYGVYTYYTSNPSIAPKCWIYRQSGGTHGFETVSDAIRDSCNYYFYEVGRRVGIETLGEYANKFGLGLPTGIEIPERTGYVAGPETSAILGGQWYEGTITSAAIGQENNLFTPLQLANYIASLVNGGTHYAAHLLKSVKSNDYSEVIYQYEPKVMNQIDIDPENLEAIKYGMYQVTQTSSVARYFNALPFKAGAKTGTAQISNNTSTNATFVCFAPYEDPQVALCLVVEKGSSGATLAALAAEMLQLYFTTEETYSTVNSENTLLR